MYRSFNILTEINLNIAIIGRYILNSSIFDSIESQLKNSSQIFYFLGQKNSVNQNT